MYSGYSPLKLATATLPLTDLTSDPNSTVTTSTASWLPMIVTDSHASDEDRYEEKDEKDGLASDQKSNSYSSVSLQVKAYMTTPSLHSVSDKAAVSSSSSSSPQPHILPLSMSYSGSSRMSKNVKPSNDESAELSLNNSLDCKNILAQCYEWTWSLGEEGRDPLIYSTVSVSTSSDCDAHQPSVKLGADKVQISVTPTSTIPPDENLSCSLLSVPRVDCFYPITWLETHIESIEAFILDITKALIEADTFVYSTTASVADSSIYDVLVNTLGHNYEDDSVDSTVGRTFFRGSRMKKDLYAQALAKNLHVQCMLVRPHSDLGRVIVYDSITCGCMSPHAMTPPQLIALKPSLHLPSTTPTGPTATAPTPHSSTAPHGLLLLEDRLQNSLNHLNSLKQHYTTLVEHKRKLVPDTRSLEYNIHQDILHNALTYETNHMHISQRKVFPTAQVLSIALNAVLVKLSLVVEGHVSHDVANTWLTHGILLTFECLLSVIGGERVMIEDSASVIYALKHFKIRILPSSNLTSHATISTNCADDEDKECSTVSRQLSKDGREMLKNLKLNPDKRHRMIQGMLYLY